jgi:hypothetical protein
VPYKPTKGGQRIGFATADGGEDEDEGGRPETAVTGVTEDSGECFFFKYIF